MARERNTKLAKFGGSRRFGENSGFGLPHNRLFSDRFVF
ncbi:hypothetical protein X732_22770 [Mesorhizobium sp. L2C066B000]|nr:hypothetical protein X732_22770 [Mesorhizobium sp. L2C066B000]